MRDKSFLPEKTVHNPALPLLQYYSVPDCMSGSQLLRPSLLSPLGLPPASEAERFSLRPGNRPHRATSPPQELRPVSHSQSHVLLRSSVFPQEYLPPRLKMQQGSSHVRLSVSSYPYPFEGLSPAETPAEAVLRSAGFPHGILRHGWIHIPGRMSPSAVHTHSNDIQVSHSCEKKATHHSADISRHDRRNGKK